MWPDAVPVLRDWVSLDVQSPTDQWYRAGIKVLTALFAGQGSGWSVGAGQQCLCLLSRSRGQTCSSWHGLPQGWNLVAPVTHSSLPGARVLSPWHAAHWSMSDVCSLQALKGKVSDSAGCWVIYGPSWARQAQQRPASTHGLCRSVGDCHRVAVGLHICSRRLEWLHYICHWSFFRSVFYELACKCFVCSK